MKVLICLVSCLLYRYVTSEIRGSVMVNKLLKVKPVGSDIKSRFVPLTEFPPPYLHGKSGRRHLEDICNKKPEGIEVHDGPRVEIFGDYYDDGGAKTVATVIIPDHIDHKHYQVTTQVPYFTVGHIEALGYHPSTIKGEQPSECEKIYQDHLETLYSDESPEYSEESLEMARMPLFPEGKPPESAEKRLENIYSDLE
ncbi:unnamed protein product [Parnassius apollo]|uniref:(apollo) hypothetical protein n=1 Tax=Parnassius apollo TaxID=110799 RepID=A0A8S3Y3D1_PARAO|nr:unnamed protein product [Parnassius apollo]